MSQALAHKNPIAELLASANVAAVGKHWEGQGGVNCGIVYDREGNFDGFLIRSIDFGEDLQWGPYGKKIEGADDRRDGRVNTKALLASGHTHPSAAWAAAYTKDGQSDFYLPAQFELNQVAIHCLDDMPNDWFWSSTQSSADTAWYQYFADGLQLAGNEDLCSRSVAVRRFNPFAI